MSRLKEVAEQGLKKRQEFQELMVDKRAKSRLEKLNAEAMRKEEIDKMLLKPTLELLQKIGAREILLEVQRDVWGSGEISKRGSGLFVKKTNRILWPRIALVDSRFINESGVSQTIRKVAVAALIITVSMSEKGYSVLVSRYNEVRELHGSEKTLVDRYEEEVPNMNGVSERKQPDIDKLRENLITEVKRKVFREAKYGWSPKLWFDAVKYGDRKIPKSKIQI